MHLDLVESGKVCGQKVTQWLQSGSQREIKSIGKLRGMVRQLLKKELTEIDELIKRLLMN